MFLGCSLRHGHFSRYPEEVFSPCRYKRHTLAKEGLASFLGNKKYPILAGKTSLHCGLEGNHQSLFHLWCSQRLNCELTAHCSLVHQHKLTLKVVRLRETSASHESSQATAARLQLPSNTHTCPLASKAWWVLTQRIFWLGWSQSLHDNCGLCCVILVSALRGREDTFFFLLWACAACLAP